MRLNRLEKRITAKKADEFEKKNKVVVFFVCFIVTFIFYITMLYLEHSILNSGELIWVYVVNDSIEAKTNITEANVDSLFSKRKVPSNIVPSGFVTDKNEIVGRLTERRLSEKEIALASDFVSEANYFNGIKNPVEVSIGVTNLAQVVGGVIREGDYVNIWSVKTTYINGETITVSVPIFMEAYVTRAFTASGVEVERQAANDTAALIINVVIPRAQEESFNTAIANGTVRISKCLVSNVSAYSEESDVADTY